MSAIKLLVCTVGIYASFFVWAVFQERVTSTAYSSIIPGEPTAKFTYIKFLNFCQCVAAALAGMVFCLIRGDALTIQPLSKFLQISATNTLGSPFSYMALNFISYPMVTLVKSCKLVPVMIMGAIIGKKRYSIMEYVSVIMISLGVVLFTCLKKDMGIDASNLRNVGIGCGLVLINLAFDGCTNALQDKMYEKHHTSSGQMMFTMNFIGGIMLLLVLVSPFDTDVLFAIITGDVKHSGGPIWLGFETIELWDALAFCTSRPEALRDVLLFAMCGASGQIFIFMSIKEFGSLINTMITITRKFFSILFSLIWFGHGCNLFQAFGILMVFAGLGIDIFIHQKKHRHRHHVPKQDESTESAASDLRDAGGNSSQKVKSS